jgi:hypothetical protein
VSALSLRTVLVVFENPPALGLCVLSRLNAVVTTSTARSMRSVDLIDTPGLVDGNVNYPFDVNRIIAEMAEIVDLVLVFLDPIGQALCSRTMNVVADLNVRGP